MSNQRFTLWVDLNGNTRTTVPLMSSSTASSTLQTALLVKSTGTVNSYSEGPLVMPGLSPSSGTYQSVRDAAILSFLCADGTIAKVTLPAPLSTIFLADQETVDSTQIPSIIAACVGSLLSASGSLASSFLGGVRA